MMNPTQVKTLEDTFAERREADRKAFLASVTSDEAYGLMVKGVKTLGDVQALMNTALDIVREHKDAAEPFSDRHDELQDLEWALEDCEGSAAGLADDA